MKNFFNRYGLILFFPLTYLLSWWIVPLLNGGLFPQGPGFAVRLTETEGRAKSVKLRCFRQPTFARKRDFRGETISELFMEGDAVVIDMTACEIADIELRFGDD